MKDLKAKDVMSSSVVCIASDMQISEIANQFAEKMISGAPVLNDSGEIIGVVSLRDIVESSMRRKPEPEISARVPDYYAQSWEMPLTSDEMVQLRVEVGTEQTAEDIMTPTVFSVDSSTPLPEVADLMLKGRIHRAVVLEKDELVGMITTLDILKAVREYA